MEYQKLETVRRTIETIKIGLLKIPGSFFHLPSRAMINAIQVDDDGYLWCTISSSGSRPITSRPVPVKVKFIQKTDGIFMDITGKAEVVPNSSIKNADLKKEDILLRISIEEVKTYQKKTISAYTSFLQIIHSFSFHRLASRKRA